jgi:hypothetical protein
VSRLDDLIIGRLGVGRRLDSQWALAVSRTPPVPVSKLERNRKDCGLSSTCRAVEAARRFGHRYGGRAAPTLQSSRAVSPAQEKPT